MVQEETGTCGGLAVTRVGIVRIHEARKSRNTVAPSAPLVVHLEVDGALDVCEYLVSHGEMGGVGGVAKSSKDTEGVGEIRSRTDHGIHELADDLAVTVVLLGIKGLATSAACD